MIQKPNQKTVSLLLRLVIGMVCIGICLSLAIPYSLSIRNRRHERVVSAMSSLVTGEGVPETATYNPDIDGPHPIVLLWADGSDHVWNWELPPNWFPTSPDKTELVALLNYEQPVAVETCIYQLTTVTRYRRDLGVIVREARTGRILTNSTLRGDEPMRCPESLPVYQTRIDGPHVALESVVKWLCPVVQPGNCP